MVKKYIVSTGVYVDYTEQSIYHDNHFTEKEFASMVNKAIDEHDMDATEEDIAAFLVKHYGFYYIEIVQHAHTKEWLYREYVSYKEEL